MRLCGFFLRPDCAVDSFLAERLRCGRLAPAGALRTNCFAGTYSIRAESTRIRIVAQAYSRDDAVATCRPGGGVRPGAAAAWRRWKGAGTRNPVYPPQVRPTVTLAASLALTHAHRERVRGKGGERWKGGVERKRDFSPPLPSSSPCCCLSLPSGPQYSSSMNADCARGTIRLCARLRHPEPMVPWVPSSGAQGAPARRFLRRQAQPQPPRPGVMLAAAPLPVHRAPQGGARVTSQSRVQVPAPKSRSQIESQWSRQAGSDGSLTRA